jgi:ABC-2 type transport system ATP-binding protein
VAAIKTYGLTKYYGRVRGIEDLNLEVEEGEVFGFLGPNGAGKTTTLRLLLGLLRPTRGRAEVFGMDCQRDSYHIRQHIGYVPGEVSLYGEMTGQELLDLVGHFHPHSPSGRARELAERLELDLSRKVRHYSKGMRQKLAIIQALAHRPRLLLLDEPTLGLDPLMQKEFYRLLAEERERGCTVFLSSHLLPEVERVCDRVGIVREGHLVAVEEVADLKRKKVRRMEVVLSREPRPGELALDGVEVLRQEGCYIELAVHGPVGQLISRLDELGIEDLVFPEASLEDTFMKFYSHEGSGEPGPLPE